MPKQINLITLLASDIYFVPSGELTSGNVQEVIMHLRDKLEQKIDKVNSIDNAISIYDGDSGNLKNSSLLIKDNILSIPVLANDPVTTPSENYGDLWALKTNDSIMLKIKNGDDIYSIELPKEI